MNHRTRAMVAVVVLFVSIVPAAPVQSFGPPEPDAPLSGAYGRAVLVSRYAYEPPTRKLVEPGTALALREPVRRLPDAGVARKAPCVQAASPMVLDQIVSDQTYDHRYEPSDLWPRMSKGNRQRRIDSLRPTVAACTVITSTDAGPGSLRQCLLDATPGTTITFDSLAFPPTAPVSITLLSPLPYIITDSLTLDGSNAGVVLDGSQLSAGPADGLVVVGADGVKIRGLQVLNFSRDGITLILGASNAVIGGDRSVGAAPLGQGNLISSNGGTGIWIEGAGTTGNQVLGNYIGTDASGTVALGSEPQGMGIFIGFGATDNVIGGESAGMRNVISGHAEYGIEIQNSGTTGNQVLGNYIGTDATGTVALGNGSAGVFILLGAQNNVVGGEADGARNVISGHTGNMEAGINIQGEGTTGNKVQGNYIGTDAAGTAPLSNAFGVVIHYGARDNVVGGNTAGARNVISGNDIGVWIQNDGTTGNQVLGNYIGTDVSGTVALGNDSIGVAIRWGAADNVIGGDATGAGNIISGNGGAGVQIQDDGTDGNRVLGNYIGTDAGGSAALGNGVLGILVSSGAADNIVGGDTDGARNIISGNTGEGIQIQTNGTTGNQVLGNYIGTDVAGMAPLGNNNGVTIVDAQDNIIGRDTAGARNVISANTEYGILIQGDVTTGNQVLGNFIGTDASGAAALGNGEDGIIIQFGAKNNIVGGDTAGARNVIAGNSDAGVGIISDGTTGNQVLGNYIGTDATGTLSLGNRLGVVIAFHAADNVIGGAASGARNVISGNIEPGIQIQDNGTTGNQVLGNYVGADVTGLAPLSNAIGIVIQSGAKNNVVGGNTAGARNVIGGSAEAGIAIHDDGTTGNRVLGNYVGVDATGLAPLGNEYGVFIESGAKNNIVGGDGIGTYNVISGNTKAGVVIYNNGTTGNQVLGNYIGTDATCTGLLGNSWDGVAIIFGASDNRIGGDTPGAGNLISGNNGGGLWLEGDRTTGNEVMSNDIVSNTVDGIYLGDGAHANTIGVSNTIAHNGSAGVAVDGITTRGNTVTRNSIHSNGDLPIKFINPPIPISAPVLTPTMCVGTAILPVGGSACPGCLIEIYGNPDQGPGGTTFLAETTASASGDFSTTVTCSPAFPYLSATATGLDGTTSEFFPGSTSTPWGMVYLPLIVLHTGDSGPEGIHGRVTYDGTGVAGIHLDLRFYDGAGWSTQATTVTGADGDYQFTGVPGLNSGQAYYVRYLNGQSGNSDNPSYLFSWYAPLITEYAGGSQVSGGDFDIADVPLVSPADGASVTLPANFLWTKRSIMTDSYRFVIFYPALNQAGATDLLGYVDGVTLTGLPSGWPSGGLYYWWVEVHHGDGTENYGEAYGANGITIFRTLTRATPGVFVSSFTLSPAGLAETHERLLELSFDQSP